MLKITVPKQQFRDEKTGNVVYSKEVTLILEHSLIAVQKWESRYHKSFFSDEDRTESETRYYIKCMTINNVSDDLVYWALTEDNLEEIDKYIHDPMSAVKKKKVKDEDSKKKKSKSKRPSRNREEYTNEYIYYLMIQNGIPFECEKWHLERLLALIKVCGEENEKRDPNKKNKKESQKTTTQQLDRMAALNERRKAALHTKG